MTETSCIVLLKNVHATDLPTLEVKHFLSM